MIATTTKMMTSVPTPMYIMPTSGASGPNRLVWFFRNVS